MAEVEESRGQTSTLLQPFAITVMSALGLMALGLASVAGFFGLYVRPTSDDYCAAYKTSTMGVFGLVSDFYTTQNGRVGNAFLSGLVYQDRDVGPKVITAVLSVLTVLAIYALSQAISTRLDARLPRRVVAAGAVVMAILLLFGQDNIYQTLFWAPGVVSHSFPTVAALAIVAFGVAAEGRRTRVGATIVAFVGGACLATTSEPVFVVGGTCAAVALAASTLIQRRIRYPAWFATAAGMGLALGLAVLWFSPGARARRELLASNGPLLSPLNITEARLQWLEVAAVVIHTPFFYGAIALGAIIGSSTLHFRGSESLLAQAGFLGLAVTTTLVSSFGVVLALRAGYGPDGWTYSRAWFAFTVPWLISLTGLGVLIGSLLRRVTRRLGAWPILVLTTVSSLAIAGLLGAATLEMRGLGRSMVVKAVGWDANAENIAEARADGRSTAAYRPIRMAGLAEPFMLSPDRDWVERCAADYFGVKKLVPPK